MPITSSPLHSDRHVDQLLTMLSVMYMNEPDAFVCDKVFPVVYVGKQSNKYSKYGKADFFRDVAQLRAPGQTSTGTGYTVSYDDYFCENYATHVIVTAEDRANADAPFDPDNDALRLVTERLKLKRDVKFANDFFKTGVWETDKVGGTDFTVWSNYANSDPITDMETWRMAAYETTAVTLNKLLVGHHVISKLKNHPDFIERIKYTQTGIITMALIAALLEVDQIHVAKGIKTTSQDGATSETFARIYGKHALLYYNPPVPSLRTPSAGYTFAWRVFGGISYIRRVDLPKNLAEMIEGHTFFDQKQVCADMGLFASGVVA